MDKAKEPPMVLRRTILRAASLAGLTVVAGTLTTPAGAADDIDEAALIKQFVGGHAIESAQVHVQMPKIFSNGYTVPLTLLVDSPMTEADHVRTIHVLAPKNPIIPVANFSFTPQSGQAKLSTRIRLAQSQYVLAIAELNDGTLLLGRGATQVDIDGCK